VLAIPTIEVSGGNAVRLAEDGGRGVRISIGDARDIARRWSAHGFRRLHVVDVDAATGRGSNRGVVRDILWDAAAPTQVGGGIGSAETVDRLLDQGAGWVVVSARAIEDPEWLAGIADENPGSVILELDVRERRMQVKRAREWPTKHPCDVLDVIDDLARAHLPLGGLLVTTLASAGLARGTELALLEDITEASPWPVIAAGAIGSMGDLRALEDRGAAGAVIGMALYSGGLDPGAVASEFAA